MLLRRAMVLLLLGLTARQTTAQLLQRGTQKLAFDIAADLEKSSSSNFVFSPYSAHSAFSQVLLGSNGESQSVLENILGIGQGDTLDYQSIRDRLSSRGSTSTLHVANILAVAQGFKPKSSYTSQLISRFESDVRELDFKNGKAAADEINGVVKSVTNNKITDLVSPNQLGEDTRILLINAIYFKAPWKTTFNKDVSFTSSFRTPSGNEEATFMTGTIKARLLQDVNNKLDILELPYTDESKSMLVVLPSDDDSTNIVNRLKNIDLSTIKDQDVDDVLVNLPKYKLRKRINLKDQMIKLGGGNIFSRDADLTNMSDEELFVTDAVQDAFVEVTEEGTEAAAATAVEIGVRTVAARAKQFIADRPFIFIIYDFDARIPLFFGKVNRPSDAGLASRSSLPSGRDAIPQPIGGGGGLNINVVPADNSAAGIPLPGQNPSANCERYLADYPNALENARLCANAEALRLFDWLRSARDTCDKSRTLKQQFDLDQCGLAWCRKALGMKAKWESEKATKCATGQDQGRCKTLTNHLSAYVTLGCDKI